MSKKIISMLLALIMAVSLIAIPVQADSSLGAATTSALNLRSGAGTSYSIILTIPNGSDILVLSTSNGWSKVIYNNTEGYVFAQYTKAKSEVSGSFGVGTITGGDVRMRSGAGTGYSILGAYAKGTVMTVTGAKDNWYKVSYNGMTGYVISDYMSVTTSVSSFDAIPVPTISIKTDTGKPTLKWSAVDGAAKYEVYRATSETGNYSKYYTTTGTSYTNTSAVPGTTYYYKVKAIAANGNESDFSVVKSITCDCAQPVATISTSASSGKPALKWSAVDGAAKYEVYRATSETGNYTKYYTTTGTSYTNTSAVPGTTYYYKVKAICGASSYGDSAFSAVKSITCDCAAPVVTISTSASSGKPALKWAAVDGAVKYEVYRATSSTGNYSKYYTTTGTSYTNTSAVPGTTYYYKVKAICGASSYGDSAFSAVKSITCDCAQPVVSIALDANGHPKLSWKSVSGASKYYIYRSTDGKNYTYWDYTSNTSFTNISSVVSGMRYYYKVRAISSVTSYADSEQSIAVSIYIDSEKDRAQADAVIRTAKSYLEVPYVYGGMSPSGFDCSGFTAYVYSQHGYSMPHSASMQFKNYGVSVPKSELRPGDLVFFHDGVDKTTAGHVGIYIGNDQFIHASSSKGQVVIESMSTTYRIEHYIGAKRLIGTQ